jgi:hypothetical protein
VVLVLVLGIGFIAREAVKDYHSTSRSTQSAVHRGLQCTVPWILIVSFVMVPSTSTYIFKTFLCDRIEYEPGEERRYLQNDLTLSCDSQQYSVAYTTALLLIAVWPVGVPLLYSALLLASRGALRNGKPSALSRATAFLAGDTHPWAFWWEPLEMCRKLALTGVRGSSDSTVEVV